MLDPETRQLWDSYLTAEKDRLQKLGDFLPTFIPVIRGKVRKLLAG